MASVGIYGAIMPYKSKIANILELVISSNVVVLLLIPNCSQITEWFTTIPEQPPPNAVVCQDNILGFTTLTILLGVVYYFPVLLMMMVIVGMVLGWTYLHYL